MVSQAPTGRSRARTSAASSWYVGNSVGRFRRFWGRLRMAESALGTRCLFWASGFNFYSLLCSCSCVHSPPPIRFQRWTNWQLVEADAPSEGCIPGCTRLCNQPTTAPISKCHVNCSRQPVTIYANCGHRDFNPSYKSSEFET
jgi:hypothetical protein